MKKLKPIYIHAMDIPDAWFMAISSVIDNGFKYTIEHGSYVGQTRLEFDHVTICIEKPYSEPYDSMLPQIPAHLNIPNPVANGYVEQYLPYLLTDHIEPNEQYTYGSRIYPQIPHMIELLKKTPNTNQAILQVGHPDDYMLEDPPCVLGDSWITTIGGLKQIKDVVIGDIVLTHMGNWKKVTDTGKKKYVGKIHKIKLKGIKDKLGITPEHELYGVEAKYCPYKNVGNLICKPNCRRKSYFKSECKSLYKDYKNEWKRASECGSLFYNRIPKIKEMVSCPYSKKQMWLFGLFLAEGDYSKEDGIRFNIDSRRFDLIGKTINHMKAEYGLECHIDTRQESCTRITFYSREVASSFIKLFNKNALTKTIPFDFIFYPIDDLIGFIAGLNDGDGYNREKRKNGAYYSISTSSPSVKRILTLILCRFNIIPVISECFPKDSCIDGRVIKANGPNWSIEFLFNNVRNRYFYSTRDFYYIPIKDNVIEDFDGYVYNLSVEDDNSYIANGITVKNCLRHIDMRIKTEFIEVPTPDGFGYVKEQTLIFYPYFRSWDLFNGFPANLAGIAVLQKMMADEIGVSAGPIIASSKGLHIYGYVEELAKLRVGKL